MRKWVDALHQNLKDDFYRLLSVGVNFTHSLLVTIARSVLSDSQNGIYDNHMIYERSGKTQDGTFLCVGFKLFVMDTESSSAHKAEGLNGVKLKSLISKLQQRNIWDD